MQVEQRTICSGIHDKALYEALSIHRGGTFFGLGAGATRSIVGSVQEAPFQSGGQPIAWTIRHHTCELLIDADGNLPVVCKCCRKYELDSLRHLQRRHVETGGGSLHTITDMR